MRGVTCAAHARARRASAPPPASAAPLRSLRDGAAAAAGKPPPPPGGRRAACAAAGKARCDAPGRHGARAAAQRHSGAFRCGWDAHTASSERARLPQQAAVHSLTALDLICRPLSCWRAICHPLSRAPLSLARAAIGAGGWRVEEHGRSGALILTGLGTSVNEDTVRTAGAPRGRRSKGWTSVSCLPL